MIPVSISNLNNTLVRVGSGAKVEIGSRNEESEKPRAVIIYLADPSQKIEDIAFEIRSKAKEQSLIRKKWSIFQIDWLNC